MTREYSFDKLKLYECNLNHTLLNAHLLSDRRDDISVAFADAGMWVFGWAGRWVVGGAGRWVVGGGLYRA